MLVNSSNSNSRVLGRACLVVLDENTYGKDDLFLVSIGGHTGDY